MDRSRLVSEFNISVKGTPNTATHFIQEASNEEKEVLPCQFCERNMATSTHLRKNQMLLELELEKLKERIDQLQKQNMELINSRSLTYEEYQHKLQVENPHYWNRQDIEAELFEAKIIIQLLLVSKSSHPQIKQLTDETLKQKYSDLLLQNLKLEEKVRARDQIIQEKQLFPLFHQDKRMKTLKKSVEYWFRKANEDCSRMKAKVRDLRVQLQDQKAILHEQLKRQWQNSQKQFFKQIDILHQLITPQDKSVSQKKIKITAPQLQKKKMQSSLSKQNDLKKFR